MSNRPSFRDRRNKANEKKEEPKTEEKKETTTSKPQENKKETTTTTKEEPKEDPKKDEPHKTWYHGVIFPTKSATPLGKVKEGVKKKIIRTKKKKEK